MTDHLQRLQEIARNLADETRARVREAIETLGYRPHAGAASLRTRRSGRIAHPIFPGELDPANTIMFEFIRALTAGVLEEKLHCDRSATRALSALGGPALTLVENTAR